MIMDACGSVGRKKEIQEMPLFDKFSKLLFELGNYNEDEQKVKIEEMNKLIAKMYKKELDCFYSFDESQLNKRIRKMIVDEEKKKEEVNEKFLVDLCECYLLHKDCYISEKLQNICIPRHLKIALNKEESEDAQKEKETALIALSNIDKHQEINKKLYQNCAIEIIKYHQEHHNLTRLAYQSIWQFYTNRQHKERELEEIIVNELHFFREASREMEELAKCVDWGKTEKELEKTKEVQIILKWIQMIKRLTWNSRTWKDEFSELICCNVCLSRAARENESEIFEECSSLLLDITRTKNVDIDCLLKKGVIDLFLEEFLRPTLNKGVAYQIFSFKKMDVASFTEQSPWEPQQHSFLKRKLGTMESATLPINVLDICMSCTARSGDRSSGPFGWSWMNGNSEILSCASQNFKMGQGDHRSKLAFEPGSDAIGHSFRGSETLCSERISLEERDLRKSSERAGGILQIGEDAADKTLCLKERIGTGFEDVRYWKSREMEMDLSGRKEEDMREAGRLEMVKRWEREDMNLKKREDEVSMEDETDMDEVEKEKRLRNYDEYKEEACSRKRRMKEIREKERKAVNRKQIKEAKLFARVFGVWVRKEWMGEEEAEMWDFAEREMREKMGLECEESAEENEESEKTEMDEREMEKWIGMGKKKKLKKKSWEREDKTGEKEEIEEKEENRKERLELAKGEIEKEVDERHEEVKLFERELPWSAGSGGRNGERNCRCEPFERESYFRGAMQWSCLGWGLYAPSCKEGSKLMCRDGEGISHVAGARGKEEDSFEKNMHLDRKTIEMPSVRGQEETGFDKLTWDSWKDGWVQREKRGEREEKEGGERALQSERGRSRDLIIRDFEDPFGKEGVRGGAGDRDEECESVIKRLGLHGLEQMGMNTSRWERGGRGYVVDECEMLKRYVFSLREVKYIRRLRRRGIDPEDVMSFEKHLVEEMKKVEPVVAWFVCSGGAGRQKG
eukprot:MONOS_5468.1-p1 / transcript=MONOS_5468.1 / gene=MONOS_5468 / organism=Monocercomonoides_exilis_PA203 / gene_product=unspecified product / transcript_product=unspecified product / location=Mono_scaffold00159:48287-52104(-) / protein_length=966 / sequence_SO=supercontig / SO=protein_coding / is_pseudo=false